MGTISELDRAVNAQELRSTYVWVIGADNEIVDWYHGTLEFCRAQLGVSFSRELENPLNKGKLVLGELFYVDEEGITSEVPGSMHDIGH